MATKTTQITSLSQFFDVLTNTTISDSRAVLYRGHPVSSYALKPSLFRVQKHRKDEKNIFRELISVHPTAFETDRNVFEQLVRMQHFSMPTRLLDLTYNPLVGLFFACEKDPRKEGALLTLTTSKRKVRYFDSDTVSCLANLSYLTGNERDALRKVETTEALFATQAGKRLFQFIRAEKPYFLEEIKPADLKSVLVVRPKQTNPRIIAQQGAFLLFGLPTKLEPDNGLDIEVTSMTVPASAKAQILKDLDRVNINRAALFPEVESAAKYIMSKLVPVPGSTEGAKTIRIVRQPPASPTDGG